MTIGQVARQLNINVQTIRFYEREGLLPKLGRSSAGYRLFDSDVIRRIQFVKHAQEVGFSLSEISTLFSLRADPDGSCSMVREYASEKIAQLESQLANMAQMKQTLETMVARCKEGLAVADCPILDALSDTRNQNS